MHAEECVRGLPAVFDPRRKRWIRPGEASADEVAAVVVTVSARRVGRRGVALPLSWHRQPSILRRNAHSDRIHEALNPA
jgi:hypothetical protein